MITNPRCPFRGEDCNRACALHVWAQEFDDCALRVLAIAACGIHTELIEEEEKKRREQENEW